MRQRSLGHAGDGHRHGIVHQPEGQVQYVDTDIDGWSAAAVFLVNETWPHRHQAPPKHPTASVVYFAQHAGRHFCFQRLRVSSEAEMLGRHQQLAGTIAGRNHLANLRRCWRKRLFTEHVFARVQGRNRDWSMVPVWRAYIDNVDVWVIEQLCWVACQFFDAVQRAPLLQSLRRNVAACHDLRLLRRGPARHVCFGNAADSHNPNFENFRHTRFLSIFSICHLPSDEEWKNSSVVRMTRRRRYRELPSSRVPKGRNRTIWFKRPPPCDCFSLLVWATIFHVRS